MTEFMVVTQVICAAGVLLLGIVTLTGRITKSLREEMRADRMAVFGEIKSLREEMHDMNGRLGRVEGHMSISGSNSSKESQ
ncbi:MAG: hypothetical protein F4X08_12040 [Gemmatimonadetes bacterium]|nr:hypothetical protein [Gemmatimonadota bacterium]MYD26533.1 hypothetical protein [Gemmatimonadota bacterium]MYI98824.1 hypothetical protein [Gemmatimonadota bacterium]